MKVELLGEALFALSDKLRASGFLNDDGNRAAYEKVVAAFQAVPSDDRLAALRDGDGEGEGEKETAWLIEHGGHSIPTYWTGESWGRWSSDHKRACRFARREDAFKVSLALGDMPHDPPHKIVEHMWMQP